MTSAAYSRDCRRSATRLLISEGQLCNYEYAHDGQISHSSCFFLAHFLTHAPGANLEFSQLQDSIDILVSMRMQFSNPISHSCIFPLHSFLEAGRNFPTPRPAYELPIFQSTAAPCMFFAQCARRMYVQRLCSWIKLAKLFPTWLRLSPSLPHVIFCSDSCHWWLRFLLQKEDDSRPGVWGMCMQHLFASTALEAARDHARDGVRVGTRWHPVAEQCIV